eukprot:3402569-Amphidinium_carterae.1
MLMSLRLCADAQKGFEADHVGELRILLPSCVLEKLGNCKKSTTQTFGGAHRAQSQGLFGAPLHAAVAGVDPQFLNEQELGSGLMYLADAMADVDGCLSSSLTACTLVARPPLCQHGTVGGRYGHICPLATGAWSTMALGKGPTKAPMLNNRTTLFTSRGGG